MLPCLVAAACGGPPDASVGEAQAPAAVPATSTTTPAPTTGASASTTTRPPADSVPEVDGPDDPSGVPEFPDLPDAPEGFCGGLATEAGRLTVEVEELLSDGAGAEARHLHALLTASGDLLDWTARNAPLAMAVDLGRLRSVYSDLRGALARSDPDTVTLDQLRGDVFAAMFEAPGADGALLDRSARRLSAFVGKACGPGYPLMDAMAGLFAADRADDVGGGQLELPGG